MKKTLFALGCALLLAGAAPVAFAQEANLRYQDPLFHNGDVDNDSIPNAEDPVDNRYDEAGNPVRFEVGDQLPPESIGNATVVTDFNVRGLRAPPGGQAWHRLGDNYYLVRSDGVVMDAIYNLHD
jgi:Ni/Co efflux regulator RcnB